MHGDGGITATTFLPTETPTAGLLVHRATLDPKATT